MLDHGGGTVQPVTYGALDPLAKSLRAFSVNLGDNPSRHDLFNRIRGASVRVTMQSSAHPLIGIVLGVETRAVALPDGRGVVHDEILNILSEAEVRSVSLALIDSVKIEDPVLAEELQLAMAAVARSRDQSKRPLSLSFAGEGTRQVTVAYLAEAPAWQTSYRLVLPPLPSDPGEANETARLQGWAIVQNTTADDWRDVTLNLVSGKPISFIQDLYTPLYVHRPTIQSRIVSSPKPQTYDSGLIEDFAADKMMANAPANLSPPKRPGIGGIGRPAGSNLSSGGGVEERARVSPDELFSEEMFAGSTSTGAQMGDALFSYEIDIPVTTPREQSAMIPFLSADVYCERVTVYNSETHSKHPLLGIALTNDSELHLMGGPITVFAPTAGASSGYTGQALIDDTEPGQKRLLTYAVDVAVTVVKTSRHLNQEILSFAVSEGILRTRRRHIHTTEYRATNHDETDRTLVIEHDAPPSRWSLTEPQSAEEETGKYYRFYRPLAARNGTTLNVREEHVDVQTAGLMSAGFSQIAVVANHDAATPEMRNALRGVLAQRQEIAQLEVEIESMRQQISDIENQQGRIRQNLAAIDHGSDLYRRYVSQLDAQETTVTTLTTGIATAEANLQTRRKALEATITAIEL